MSACGACGADNPAGNAFCRKCGQALQESCPNCGRPASPDDDFCGKCGTPLGDLALSGAQRASATAPGPSTAGTGAIGLAAEEPVSERRVCSILFADLVGFTPFSESRDSEDVRAVLSRYSETARTIVTRYGGIVEKFIGDAVMAVWGTPLAAEGDVERAVRAGLDLVAAVGVLGKEVGADGLAARGGIVTGEVAVRLGATGEGMVAGDAVNTASRVQATAPSGSVFVDETTRRLSSASISFEDAGAHELKGKESPEQLYRVVRVLAGAGGNKRADGIEAPLEGRDVEFRAIKDLFHASAERRSPRLVVVSGPAGVGKSRLGWEFDKYIDGLADTVLWHAGRCLSYGEGVAFWALAEIVRQRFGIAEEDPPVTSSQKLAEGLVRFVSDEAERDYVGVRLARLLGVDYPSEQRVVLTREELFAGWRLFFERLAEVAPVVLLVEDGQYADSGLLEFFEHLVDWSRDLPIFVLVFARPGLDAIDSGGFGVGRNRTTLSLDPLDTGSMEALVDSLVPGMPASAKEAIATHAQGIALFAVETIRSLIDSGTVVREGESYRLVEELGALSVPDSLHALLAARLDALPPEVRSLVADASVLGTSFPEEALVAVSSLPEETVRTGLGDLVRRDVLEVSADPLSPERGSYRFGQEMLRQVAYQTISRRDRKARHLAVAQHLRAAFANDGEEISDVIARHYLDAREVAPEDPDAEELATRATGFLIRAAERAERAGSPGRAADSFSAAADLTADDADAAALFERAAEQSSRFGGLEDVRSHGARAEERYVACGDVRGAARARTKKATALAATGRVDEARREFSEALEVLRVKPDHDTVSALGRLAGVEAVHGDTETAERVSAEALSLAQAFGIDEADMAAIFLTRGLAASFADRRVEAAAFIREALHLAERAGDTSIATRSLACLIDVLTPIDPSGAIDAALRAIEESRRTGQRLMLGLAADNMALALMEIGQWDEASAVVRRVVEEDHLDDLEDVRYRRAQLAALRGDADGCLAALSSLSVITASESTQDRVAVASLQAAAHEAAGHTAEALDAARRAVALSEGVGITFESVRWAFGVAARSARALGDDEALGELAELLDAHPVGHLPPVLRAERQLLLAWRAAMANEVEAGRLYEEAIAALRKVGNPYELGHGLVDMASFLSRDGEGERAALLLDEVQEIAGMLSSPLLASRSESLAKEAMPAAETGSR